MNILKGHWQLMAITALVFLLWSTDALVPLKILIVFLHELSHAIVITGTGGEVLDLSVSAQQGGLVTSRGGSRFWGLTAGYLGSLLIGVALLVVATRTKADRIVMGGFGAIMLLVSALYIRDGFALLFCVGTGFAMVLSARFLSQAINDLFLRVIGLTSMIYVPYDIFSDTIARSQLRSDARMLAEEFGGTTMMWGGLWLVFSLIAIGLCCAYGLGSNSNVPLKRKTPG